MDSDGDGLTDIVESKFRTDPSNKDTNSNGVPDNLDLNPRHNIPRTDKTIVFETIIDEVFRPRDWSKIKSEMDLSDSLTEKETVYDRDGTDIPDYIPSVNYANDSTETVLIVTDDPSIQAVQSKYVRVIIISTEEYKKSRNSKFKSELDDFSISPMFKVNGTENLFIIDYSYMTFGETYLVQKTKDGWRIKSILMYIS